MKDDVRKGRPPKYSSVEKFQAKIDEYFASITDDDGEFRKPPTVSGLAVFLGFVDRRSMYHYRDKDAFYHPVKRAIGIIEAYNEEKAAIGKNCIGNIFLLKNFGWSDRQEVTTTSDMTIKWDETRTYSNDADAEAE
jgi:hypothetical protein